MSSEESFPIITAQDLPATLRFYEALGFSLTYQFPTEGEPRFVTVERGDSSIGIGVDDGGEEDRVSYWVYVEDVDATLTLLLGAGATVVAEPDDQPWGERVARVRDPDGNLVHLGSAV